MYVVQAKALNFASKYSYIGELVVKFILKQVPIVLLVLFYLNKNKKVFKVFLFLSIKVRLHI